VLKVVKCVDDMPRCKNDSRRRYSGREQCPTGRGYCSAVEPLGKVRVGRDGSRWVVRGYGARKGSRRRWVPTAAKTQKKKKKKAAAAPVLFVYGAHWCKFCVKAKDMLRGQVGRYIELKDRANAAVQAALPQHHARLKQLKFIPAVFVGKKYLGGSDKLALYLEKQQQLKRARR
jgi:glutaredoxin